MRKNTLHPQIEVLLDAIDLAFDHRAWHGPNLRGSIRGVTSREAAWRPGSGRHNIWELVVHAAYWKYAARRRLRGDRRGAFPRSEEHTSELQSRLHLVCRLLLEKKKKKQRSICDHTCSLLII